MESDGTRAELIEATLRVLDDNPTYVDEFFAQARRHHPTLDRFLANAAREMEDEELAQLTAKHLVAHPSSLHEILIRTLDAAKDEPKAREATASAILERSETATDIMTDDPELVKAALRGTIQHVMNKPEARAAFLVAMQEMSPVLGELIADNPKTLRAMMEAVLEAGVEEARELMLELVGASP